MNHTGITKVVGSSSTSVAMPLRKLYLNTTSFMLLLGCKPKK
jgi:hypothetical protein